MIPVQRPGWVILWVARVDLVATVVSLVAVVVGIAQISAIKRRAQLLCAHEITVAAPAVVATVSTFARTKPAVRHFNTFSGVARIAFEAAIRVDTLVVVVVQVVGGRTLLPVEDDWFIAWIRWIAAVHLGAADLIRVAVACVALDFPARAVLNNIGTVVCCAICQLAVVARIAIWTFLQAATVRWAPRDWLSQRQRFFICAAPLLSDRQGRRSVVVGFKFAIESWAFDVVASTVRTSARELAIVAHAGQAPIVSITTALSCPLMGNSGG